MPRLPHGLFIALIPVLSTGCGSKMAPVHGKLVFEGKPVTAGSVSFAPKGEGFDVGKPATGTPDENGAFQLSTYALNDGALVGTHVVIYSPPEAPTTDDPVMRPKLMKEFQQFGQLKLPPNHEVEIKPGKNEITLELRR